MKKLFITLSILAVGCVVLLAQTRVPIQSLQGYFYLDGLTLHWTNTIVDGSAGNIVGTVINTGTPDTNAVPKYLDNTGTNIGPSSVTIIGNTNLSAPYATFTNGINIPGGGIGTMTVNNNLIATNTSTAASVVFTLDSATSPSLVLKDSNTNYLGLYLGSLTSTLKSPGDLYFQSYGGSYQLAFAGSSFQGGTNVSLGSNSSNGGWLDQYLVGTFYLYGTGLGSTNYERLSIDHATSSGIVYDSQANGSGSYRSHVFKGGATNLFTISPSNGVQSTYRTLTDGATITLTADFSNVMQHDTVTLAGNRALVLTNLINGMEGTLIVKQDTNGNRALSLPGSSKVINGGSGAITLTTNASAIDILSWTYDGTYLYWTYGKNFN